MSYEITKVITPITETIMCYFMTNNTERSKDGVELIGEGS